ncbi:uncharacterized protein BDV17DRAFT_258819 [Aspergillus undulatus]|uniref:uncharacterized protein n=1 Tax=Aspergillus undulatus TaxID=1810928 RepID=UPI003CCCE337
MRVCAGRRQGPGPVASASGSRSWASPSPVGFGLGYKRFGSCTEVGGGRMSKAVSIASGKVVVAAGTAFDKSVGGSAGMEESEIEVESIAAVAAEAWLAFGPGCVPGPEYRLAFEAEPESTVGLERASDGRLVYQEPEIVLEGVPAEIVESESLSGMALVAEAAAAAEPGHAIEPVAEAAVFAGSGVLFAFAELAEPVELDSSWPFELAPEVYASAGSAFEVEPEAWSASGYSFETVPEVCFASAEYASEAGPSGAGLASEVWRALGPASDPALVFVIGLAGSTPGFEAAAPVGLELEFELASEKLAYGPVGSAGSAGSAGFALAALAVESGHEDRSTGRIGRSELASGAEAASVVLGSEAWTCEIETAESAESSEAADVGSMLEHLMSVGGHVSEGVHVAVFVL